MIKRKKFYLILLGCITILTSCDTFWETMAQGYGGYGTGGYGMGYQMFPGYTPPPPVPTAEQILKSAAQEVERQNQQGYQAAKRYRPNLTYDQYLTEQAQLYEMTKNSGGGSSATSSSSSSSTSSSSSSRSNNKDCRLCLGTGVCQTCNGKGYYYPLTGGNSSLCPNCASNHNGKCFSCKGSGKMYN